MRTKLFLHLDLFYEANPEVNLNEIYLLSWFIDFYHTGKLMEFTYAKTDNGYLWFSYSYFLKQNPFFNIKTRRGIYNLIQNLERKGFIKINPQKEWMRKNQKLLIKFTPRTEEICEKLQPKDFSGNDEI